MHKPDGLGRETPWKWLVKGMELDVQTGHTVAKAKYGDDQTKAHTSEGKLGLLRSRQKPEDSEETTVGGEE